MGQPLVEVRVDRRLPGMSLPDGPQLGFVVRLARAEQHELQVARQQVVEGPEQDVDSLLLGQPGHHAHQRSVGDRQADALLEVGPAVAFAREVGGGIRTSNEAVGGRVPDGVVHAVEDPDELPGALPEHAVEPVSENWRRMQYWAVTFGMKYYF